MVISLPLLCKYLKEFHYTREGKINGYCCMFYALKQYCKEKNIDILRDFSEKEMRKIMNDHALKAKKRANYPCKKPKVHSIE